MKVYLDLVQTILASGKEKSDRTGVGTLSIFGYQFRHRMADGFPLLTTKKVFFASVIKELLWFIRGSTNINDGLDCGIWDSWADSNGNLGPIYGHQWRSWMGYHVDPTTGTLSGKPIDQLAQVISDIQTNPHSRRHIVSAWNVADLDKMALPPCHLLFQFYVNGNQLDLQLYQRSADVAIGVPFNIASYALLLHLVAAETGLVPGEFIHTFGDAHIYLAHIPGLQTQLTRTPTALPTLRVEKKPLFDIQYGDIHIENYSPAPPIPFTIAV